MKPYYDHAGITIYHGDCLELLPRLAFNSFVTDPGDDATVGPRAVSLALSHADRGAVFSGIRLNKYPEPRDIGCVYCPAGTGCGPWGSTCFHPILFYGERPGGVKSPSSIHSFAKSDNLGHPCAKPVPWLMWLVHLVSLEADVILDPFMGSGTTLLAAKDLGRRAIGIEIDEKYCKIAAKRLNVKFWEPITDSQILATHYCNTGRDTMGR